MALYTRAIPQPSGKSPVGSEQHNPLRSMPFAREALSSDSGARHAHHRTGPAEIGRHVGNSVNNSVGSVELGPDRVRNASRESQDHSIKTEVPRRCESL